MSNNFRVSSGGKFSFISESTVRDKLDQAGRRTVVLVEGRDDEVIYEIFYHEKLAEVKFIEVGGCDKVKKYLGAMVEKLPNEKGYFGIVDRDFRTDSERTQDMNDPNYDQRLYIFLRYTLENYFVETPFMVQFLKEESINHQSLQILDVAAVERLILDTLANLIPLMAGNWTLRDFHEDFLRNDKNSIPCDETWVRERLEEVFSTPIPAAVESKYEQHKATMLQSRGDINELQKYISGKNFLHHFGRNVVKAVKSQEPSAKVHLDLSREKAQLAGIVQRLGLPGELEDILRFVGIA